MRWPEWLELSSACKVSWVAALGTSRFSNKSLRMARSAGELSLLLAVPIPRKGANEETLSGKSWLVLTKVPVVV